MSHLDAPSIEKLLNVVAVGSVDDGKSTLIGRLLLDSGSVYDDQVANVRELSKAHPRNLDLALITDGLRDEREQGITIDVAYRYCNAGHTHFRVADVPGHEEYTRNMATGASTADVCLLVADVTKGLLSQTRRHAAITSLFGIRHVALVVNKMDLVDFKEEEFLRLRREFGRLASSLGYGCVEIIPVSALEGDNVVAKTERMGWYEGPTLMEFLESVQIQRSRAIQALRLPIQLTLRDSQCRWYGGQIASGTLTKDQQLKVMSSGMLTRVSRIVAGVEEMVEATAPRSVAVLLQAHLDIGRGDMLVDPRHPATSLTRFHAIVVWLGALPLKPQDKYFLKHTSNVVCAQVVDVISRLDVTTLEKAPADALELNEIGEIELETHKPIFCDCYGENRATGSIILVNATENNTVAAGMISTLSMEPTNAVKCPDQAGLLVWFTGLSGAGKTTICQITQTELLARGLRVECLDGDIVRTELSKDLDFSKKGRDENVRRVGVIGDLLSRNGVIVLAALVSPYRSGRDEIRQRCPDRFLEVFVNAPLSICEERDTKGLYKRARSGQLVGLTGIDDPYEPPLSPEVRCETDQESIRQSVNKVLSMIEVKLEKLAAGL